MVFETLKQFAHRTTNGHFKPHPFDPLSPTEIEEAVSIVHREHQNLFYNAVTLQEPRKVAMTQWLSDPNNAPRPRRLAEVIAIGPRSQVFEGLVDLDEQKIAQWESIEGVQPLVLNGAIKRRRRYSRLIDHHGRPPTCRAYRAQRSKSN